MQNPVNLAMNGLYGAQIRKNINESYKCESQTWETWMENEYDENVIDYWKLPNDNYIVKMKKDDGIDNNDLVPKNTLPAHQEAPVLSNTKRNLKNFVR